MSSLLSLSDASLSVSGAAEKSLLSSSLPNERAGRDTFMSSGPLSDGDLSSSSSSEDSSPSDDDDDDIIEEEEEEE